MEASAGTAECVVEEKTIVTKSLREWSYLRWRPANEAPKDRAIMHHSIFMDKHLWDDIARFLCTEFQMEVYAFDLLGHGNSSKDMAGVNYDTIQEDVVNIVETLQLHPCHYFGCSIGSEWGLRMGISHPDYLKSICVIGASTMEPTEEDRTGFGEANAGWRKGGMSFLADYMLSETFFFANHFLTDDSFKAQREAERKRISSMSPATFDIVDLWVNRSHTHDYSEINIKTLIMCGADDEYFLAHSENLFSLLPNAKLEFIPDAGHEGPVENPESCIETIGRFLREL